MKLALYIDQFFILLLTMKFTLCLWPYPYSIPMVILYARSHAPYPWLYLYSMPMAILYEIRSVYSSILYTRIYTSWNILNEISFIYRLIFYTLAYYEIYSMPMAILHARSYTLYLWPYSCSIPMAIPYTRSYTS